MLSVDDRQKVIDLARSPAGRPPRFAGGGSRLHDRVREEMLAVYHDSEVPSFLDRGARELLLEARDNFERLGLDRSTVIASGDDTVVFPWVGDRIVGTLAALLTAGGLEVANDGIALTITHLTPEALAAELAVLVPGGPPDPLELAAVVPNKEAEKFDGYLGEDLLNAGYAARSLDPAGAWVVLERVLGELAGTGSQA